MGGTDALFGPKVGAEYKKVTELSTLKNHVYQNFESFKPSTRHLLLHYTFDSLDQYPIPDIILLDLNMPKKDGRTALAEIKSHDDFKKIPVIIFTTSNHKDDIEVTYKMGTNSYITKPGSFDGLVKVAKEIENYWSNTVKLPA